MRAAGRRPPARSRPAAPGAAHVPRPGGSFSGAPTASPTPPPPPRPDGALAATGAALVTRYRPTPVAEDGTTTAQPVTTDGRHASLPDAETCRDLLALMALIRRFEEEAGRQYQRAKAGGFLHLAIGEEATIVGTTSAMEADDYLIGTYRTHGHAIARGTDPRRVMAELFGRVDGTSGGRGGSMHVFDGERRVMGGYGIVGGTLPLAAGLGLSSVFKGE